jgi:hypothetical protein
MARPTGANVHVGKAAALIVIAFALGFLVLNDKGSSDFAAAAAARAAVTNNNDNFTETTLPADDEEDTTTTTAATERQPAQIKVIAINATGRGGVAGQATTKLRNAGYNALQPGNATQSVTNTHPASVVYYTAGYQKEALTVAALFSLPDSAVRAMPNPSPSPDIKPEANNAVLVGTGIALT